MPRSLLEVYTKFQKNVAIFQTNAELSTLLTIGMCIQTIAFIALPYYLTAAPALLYLFHKLLRLRPSMITDNQYMNEARLGLWSASVPNNDGTIPEKAAANGIVCFVVGSQQNQ